MFKMSKLVTSFYLICIISLIVAQKCHEIMNVQLQDSIIINALAPFDDYGNVNYALIPYLAQYYKGNNWKVIYVTGYYGASLPLSERKRLVDIWDEQANIQGLDLIVEVGALPYVDTLELARHCSKLNVTAITAFAEVVYQATTLAEAIEDLQRICDAAPNLPLLYHELLVVDQNIKTDEIFKGAMDGCVSCFVGVVTSVNTFLDMKASVDSIDGYQFWNYGVNAVAAAYKVGMNASKIVNLFPDLFREIEDAVNNCQLKLAEDLQQELNRRMYAITNVNGGTIDTTSRSYFEQIKAAVQILRGIKLGYRYPLERPNSTVIKEIRSNLVDLEVPLYSSENKN